VRGLLGGLVVLVVGEGELDVLAALAELDRGRVGRLEAPLNLGRANLE
jgi:hypothetical protein